MPTDETAVVAPDAATAEAKPAPVATPQPQGAQEGKAADPWSAFVGQIKDAGFQPNDIVAALKAQQYLDEIEQQGGMDKLILEGTEQRIAELRKTAKGRDLLRKWAGVDTSEEELTPEEKRIRALEDEIAGLKEVTKKTGDTGREAYLRSQEIQNERRWDRELDEVVSELPELAPFKQDLRVDLLKSIAANPKEFGGPGWIKQAAKFWYDRALTVHKVMSERQPTKGRTAPGGGGGGAPEKKPEDMNDDELRQWNYKHFGI